MVSSILCHINAVIVNNSVYAKVSELIGGHIGYNIMNTMGTSLRALLTGMMSGESWKMGKRTLSVVHINLCSELLYNVQLW